MSVQPCPSTACTVPYTHTFICPPPTHQFGCPQTHTCPPSAAPHLCVSLPFCPTETCPPTHLIGCTMWPTSPRLCVPISLPGQCPTVGPQCYASGGPACGQTITTPYQQTPQQQGGGRPQFYQGGRSGTYNPYGD
ncbi:MAG TPA: hypothetical protein VIW69_09560 [Candidatus Elarobacter sp.]